MSYITESELRRRVALPIALPLTELKQNDWLVLATVKLLAGMNASYKWLSLQVTDYTVTEVDSADPCAAAALALNNTAFGIAYLAIYKTYSPSSDPSTLTYIGASTDVVTVSTTGISNRDTSLPDLTVTDAGEYSWVLVNNASNATIRVSATGQVIVNV